MIFDPRAPAGEDGSRDRVPLQVYHRTDEGLFVRRYAGPGPAYLRTLDVHAVAVASPSGARLRLARDAAGRDLVPTSEVAQEAAERERNAERSRREAAERELAELRDRLRRLEGLGD